MTPNQSWIILCLIVIGNAAMIVLLGRWIDTIARQLYRVEAEVKSKQDKIKQALPEQCDTAQQEPDTTKEVVCTCAKRWCVVHWRQMVIYGSDSPHCILPFLQAISTGFRIEAEKLTRDFKNVSQSKPFKRYLAKIHKGENA